MSELKLDGLPDAYRLITCKATDISQMTVVADIPTSEVKLVSRIHGWKPVPAARIISAAEKRKQKDCPLCNATDREHSIVWHAYGVKKDVKGAVVAAQDLGLSVTPELIKRHFPNHNYDQPAPLKRLSVDEQLHLADTLSDRCRRILLTVYRQRALSTRQIVQLFYESSTSNDTSAKKSAYRDLHTLRFEHLLYPFRTEKRKSPEVYYALGRHAVPYVENQEGRLTGETTAVSRRDQVKEYQLEHDLLAADVFVQMRRQLYTSRTQDNLVSVNGQPMSLHMHTDCWWGERSLRMAYQDPITRAEQLIIPDGFAAIKLNDGRHYQFMLPFFIEWDSGTKPIEETSEQLINYVALARSGSVGKRFPQLNVEGYAPPVLMVTSTPARAQRLAGMTKTAMTEKGLTREEVPGMFITDLETMRNSAYAPGAWREVMADGPVTGQLNIVEQLLNANQKLIQVAPIHWRVPIAMDPDGARPSAPKTSFQRGGRDRKAKILPRYNAIKERIAAQEITDQEIATQVQLLIGEGDEETTGLDRVADITSLLEDIARQLEGE